MTSPCEPIGAPLPRGCCMARRTVGGFGVPPESYGGEERYWYHQTSVTLHYAFHVLRFTSGQVAVCI